MIETVLLTSPTMYSPCSHAINSIHQAILTIQLVAKIFQHGCIDQSTQSKHQLFLVSDSTEIDGSCSGFLQRHPIQFSIHHQTPNLVTRTPMQGTALQLQCYFQQIIIY